MKKIKIFNVVIILFSLTKTSFANRSAGDYGKALVESINYIQIKINERQKEFCKDVIEDDDSDKYTNCSDEMINALQSRQYLTYNIIGGLLSKIQEYEKNYSIERTKNVSRKGKRLVTKEKSILSFPKKMLDCISRHIKNSRFVCNSTVPSCKRGAIAYTLPLVKTRVHLCPKFLSKDVNFQAGTIMHELAHKCGATDAAFFNSASPPKSKGMVYWSYIADTYFYWANYGFCVPGIDCRPKKTPSE